MSIFQSLIDSVNSILSETPSSSSTQSNSSSSSPMADGNERTAYKLKSYFNLAKDEIDKAVRSEEWGLPDEAVSHYQTALTILAEAISIPVPSYISSSELEKVKSYRQKISKWQGQVTDRLQTLRQRTGGTSTAKAQTAVRISPIINSRKGVVQKSSTLPRDGIVKRSQATNNAQTAVRISPIINSRKGVVQKSSTLPRDGIVKRSQATNNVSSKPVKDYGSSHDPKLIEMINSLIVDRSPSVKWEDIAGLEKAKQALLEMVILPIRRRDLFTGLRKPARGLLLFGPPGTGKTLLAKAVASESQATFFNVSASSLTSKWMGEGEKLVRTLFMVAISRQPSVIFIDEIDSIMSTRTSSENEASRRLKSEFLVQFDGVMSDSGDLVIVIGATNKPNELDDAVLRRLVKRIYIPLPDATTRKQLFTNKLKGHAFSLPDRELERLVRDTEGYSGSDLQALCEEAAMMPIRELGSNILSVNANQIRGLRFEDFQKAMKVIRPSLQKSKWAELERWNQEFGAN